MGVTGMLSHKRGGHSSLVLQAQVVIHQGVYRPLRRVIISGVLQSQGWLPAVSDIVSRDST